MRTGGKKKGDCLRGVVRETSERAREGVRGAKGKTIFTCVHMSGLDFAFSPLFVHVGRGVRSSCKDRRFVRDMCSLLACVARRSLWKRGLTTGRLKKKGKRKSYKRNYKWW